VSHRENRIDAFAGILDHLIADIVDEVDVVAGAPGGDIRFLVALPPLRGLLLCAKHLFPLPMSYFKDRR
jgi:hypothetical protein